MGVFLNVVLIMGVVSASLLLAIIVGRIADRRDKEGH